MKQRTKKVERRAYYLDEAFYWSYELTFFLKLFFAGKMASISTDDHKVGDDDNFDEFLEGMFP